jgi:hypothetical protein
MERSAPEPSDGWSQTITTKTSDKYKNLKQHFSGEQKDEISNYASCHQQTKN